jgi:diaminopimelate epimerase
MRFVKMHGCGNDYVYVDCVRQPPPRDPAALARVVSDRHFGVGGDGLILICPSERADARMRMFNADGSEAEMCGNGLRCVAKVLYESDPALRRPTLRIETGAGVLTCTLEIANGVVTHVTEEMGRPRLTRGEIPLLPGGDTRALREPIRARDRDFRFTAVSMGNPHAVIFVDGDDDLRALAETYGPTLEVADRFPRRTNVEFARVRGSEIDLVVWERGSGLTLACGTGACATVVAACLEERLTPGAVTPVHLPGGTLAITVAPDYAGVRLRGPARIAFTGTLDLTSL